MGDKSPKAKDKSKKQATNDKAQKATDAKGKAASNDRKPAPKK